MPSSSLHPLARQAIDLAARPDCPRWAVGLTKYFVHDDPVHCLQWTKGFLLRQLQSHADHPAVQRSIEYLTAVLAQPSRASLGEMNGRAWLSMSHTDSVDGAGELARLIWAAMGIVGLSRPNDYSSAEFVHSFGVDPNVGAMLLVFDQCAMAIEMFAADRPGVPFLVAEAFTATTCHEAGPPDATAIQRFQWSWEDLVFDIAILRDAAGEFHLEFIDRQGGTPLYSGPFTTTEEVESRFDLFQFQPKTVRILPCCPL